MSRLLNENEQPFMPTEKTKHFIVEVERLKEEGEFKSYVNLGKEIGIGGPTLSNIRNGRADITPDAYRRFCDLYLKGNISGLLNESVNKVSEKESPAVRNEEEYLRGIIQDLAKGGVAALETNKSIADANKSIAEANRIMAISHDKLIDSNKELVDNNKGATSNNNDLIQIIKMAYDKNISSSNQKQDSLQLSQTFDQMAEVEDFPEGEMSTFEGRRKFYHKIFALSQRPKNASDNSSQADIQHKS